jgi:hypothetical protein
MTARFWNEIFVVDREQILSKMSMMRQLIMPLSMPLVTVPSPVQWIRQVLERARIATSLITGIRAALLRSRNQAALGIHSIKMAAV